MCALILNIANNQSCQKNTAASKIPRKELGAKVLEVILKPSARRKRTPVVSLKKKYTAQFPIQSSIQ